MSDGKTLVFIGGPMSGYMDQRYSELYPVMQFRFFPDKSKRDESKMLVYQFVHFQDDAYYFEFVKTFNEEEA